jgi:hypothetical protein
MGEEMRIKLGLCSVGLSFLVACSVNPASPGKNGSVSVDVSPSQSASPAGITATLPVFPTNTPLRTAAAPADPESAFPIVANGGFEQGAGGPLAWETDAWIRDRSVFRWEPDHPGCNGKCVSITNPVENDARWIQKIRVIPGEKYTLSGRIKGDNIQGNAVGANLYVTVSDFYHTDSMGSTGTFDWKTVSLSFTGPSSGEVVIGCRLGFYASTVTGTAYFDDILVEAASTSPRAEPTKANTTGRLTADPAADADLETVPSIWTLTHFKFLAEPGSNTYTVQITHDSAWLWDYYLCTTEATFQDYLDALDVEFRIDKVHLEDRFIRIYERPGAQGWLCRYWSTKLTNWPQDRTVFLEILSRLNRPASDGKDEFTAGDYSQTIIVSVIG